MPRPEALGCRARALAKAAFFFARFAFRVGRKQPWLPLCRKRDDRQLADLLPNAPDRKLISLLRTALQGSRVTWLELERDFAAARRAGRDPQQLDDTHWSAYGVRLAARNIAAWIGAGAEAKNTKDSTSPTNPMFR